MKNHKKANRLRFPLLLLSISFIVTGLITTVWVPASVAGSRGQEIKDSASPVDAFDASELEQLPANQRSFQDLQRLAPGIVVQDQQNNEGNVSIRGLPSTNWRDYSSATDIDGVTLPAATSLSYSGFDFGYKDRFDMGLTYSSTYKGWNDQLHRDTLRFDFNPFDNTILTPESVSQPEYVTGLPATFYHYKPIGELSLGSIGFDYRYTDPGVQPSYGTSDQSASGLADSTASSEKRELLRTITGGLMTGKPIIDIGQTVYQNTDSIITAAEAVAMSYAAHDMVMWDGEPPNAEELDEIIGSALLTTWFMVLQNGDAISPRDAALAMANTAFTLSGDLTRAHEIAMFTLDNYGNATEEDRTFVNGVLGFVAMGQMFAGRMPAGVNYDSLYKPEKGVGKIALWGQVELDPVFTYLELWRWFMGPVAPNDPLYKKEGGGKAAAGLKKGLGFLLGAVGAPVAVEDNLANDQWGLHAVGFTPRGAPGSAWDIVDGSHENVVVAVIDSGLDTAHPDGPEYQWTNADEVPDNGVDDDANGYVDDVHGWNFVGENNDIRDDFGHGTFVAGIIAAKRNNGVGIAGINPGARIMTLKVLSEKGSSKSIGVYRAVRYAVDNGARVLNLSLGGRGLSPLEQIGINYAYTMGCIVVVAAGNQSGNIAEFGPPGARRSFSVASMNMDSSRRDASNKGLNVALAAPGESVYSLTAQFEGDRDARVVPLFAKGYHRLNGTSFAAPFVAATASLIWTKHPHLDQRQVEDMILASAQDIHDPGWDLPTGQGKLDAFAALSQDPDRVLVPRITEFFVNKVKRRIASVDIYGVVRGDLKNYTVEVGRGTKPKKWQKVYGPSASSVDHNLICRIDGQYFAKGSKWKVRVTATGNDGQRTSHEVLVSKK